MVYSTLVLSLEEMLELLRAGKIDEFNQRRPRSIFENSDRVVGNEEFLEYIDDKNVRERINFGGTSTDLSGLNLTGVNFSGIDFSECHLEGANLTDANLAESDFHLAKLKNVEMSGACVYQAHFWQADLEDVDLSVVESLGMAYFSEARNLSEKSRNAIVAGLRQTWLSVAEQNAHHSQQS